MVIILRVLSYGFIIPQFSARVKRENAPDHKSMTWVPSFMT